jgi:hypothetical protein
MDRLQGRKEQGQASRQKEDRQAVGQKGAWTGFRAERSRDRLQGRRKIDRLQVRKEHGQASGQKGAGIGFRAEGR